MVCIPSSQTFPTCSVPWPDPSDPTAERVNWSHVSAAQGELPRAEGVWTYQQVAERPAGGGSWTPYAAYADMNGGN